MARAITYHYVWGYHATLIHGIILYYLRLEGDNNPHTPQSTPAKQL